MPGGPLMGLNSLSIERRSAEAKQKNRRMVDMLRSMMTRDDATAPTVAGPLDEIKEGANTDVYQVVMDQRINNGRPSLVPTTIGGNTLTTEQATEMIVRLGGIDPDTDQPVESFDSIEEASIAAKKKGQTTDMILMLLGLE